MKGYTPSGILLADIDVISAMDKDISGRFIPVKLKKDGDFTKTSSVLSADGFKELEEKLEKILADVGREMREGLADAHPFKDAQKDACGYCKFQSICRYESIGASDE